MAPFFGFIYSPDLEQVSILLVLCLTVKTTYILHLSTDKKKTSTILETPVSPLGWKIAGSEPSIRKAEQIYLWEVRGQSSLLRNLADQHTGQTRHHSHDFLKMHPTVRGLYQSCLQGKNIC